MQLILENRSNCPYADFVSKTKHRHHQKMKTKSTTTTTAAALAPIKNAICVLEMATAPSEARRIAALRALMGQLETPDAMKAIARAIVSERYAERPAENLFVPWATVYKALASINRPEPDYRVVKHNDGIHTVADRRGVVVFQSRDRQRVDAFIAKNTAWNATIEG